VADGMEMSKLPGLHRSVTRNESPVEGGEAAAHDEYVRTRACAILCP